MCVYISVFHGFNQLLSLFVCNSFGVFLALLIFVHGFYGFLMFLRIRVCLKGSGTGAKQECPVPI